MIERSLLASTLGVNGQVKCDCGGLEFEIGIALNPTNGNNFIRILQCVKCRAQMPATHKTDAGLAPSVGLAGAA